MSKETPYRQSRLISETLSQIKKSFLALLWFYWKWDKALFWIPWNSLIKPLDKVLELGCGYGRVLVELAKKAKTVAGIDNSYNNIRMAKEFLKDKEVHSAWQKIDFPVYAENSDYAKDGILELSSWLKEKGLLKIEIDSDKIFIHIEND